MYKRQRQHSCRVWLNLDREEEKGKSVCVCLYARAQTMRRFIKNNIFVAIKTNCVCEVASASVPPSSVSHRVVAFAPADDSVSAHRCPRCNATLSH